MVHRNFKYIVMIDQRIVYHRLILGKNRESLRFFETIFPSPSSFSFNQLDLPAYESYDKLRKMLLIAIRECAGFGFA